MKLVKVISTAALILLLGTSASVYAQKGQKEKGGGGQKAQQAQRGGGQKAQKERPAQHQQRAQRTQQPQHTQRAQRTQQPQRVQRAQHTQQAQQRGRQQGQRVAYNRGNNGNHYGRIPDDRYRAHFGRDHRFRMGRPRFINGYNRFQYGGYWFGFNEPWPYGWGYNDDFYVEYIDGVYYMFNLRHRGFRLTLNLF